MLAAGAALVAAVLVPVILLTGGGDPAADGSTTTSVLPETSTSAQTATTVAPTTTTTPGSTTTVPAETSWSGIVYVYQTPQDSFLGNPALVPIVLDLTDLSGQLVEGDQFTEALAALPTEMPELKHGLANAIPPEVQIVDLSTTTVDGAEFWAADMNEAFLAGAGGLLADFTMLNQLIYTITHGEGADVGVLFSVGGQPVTAFGSEGLDLSQPVHRDDFLDQLAPIFLTEPITPIGDIYPVIGVANVFEASLTVQLLDGDEAVVHEEHLTATCGSGCWGEFGAEIASDLIVPGESSVRVLTFSAEDGSAQDVVTVPIPADGVWSITVG
jgi:hypothetical protein